MQPLRFITTFTNSRFQLILWAISVQSMKPLHFPKIHFYLTPSSNRGFLQGVFICDSQPKPVYIYPLPHTCYMTRRIRSFCLITQTIFGKNSHHYVFQCVVFSTLLLPLPSKTQILSSALYSQTHSSYVPPLMWATKCYTQTNR
jgi:hypothetical protein